MHDRSTPYADARAVASYAEQAPRKVPGLADLHRMTMLLLAERAPEQAHMLVVGAGGGMETLALARAQPGWRFTGVDPSPAMLDLARQAVLPFAERIDLLEGTVDAAPAGPFDGACCLLTLHHVPRSERLHTLRDIHRRLKPGACIVTAGHAAPGPDPERWLTRSAAFGERGGLDWIKSASTGRLLAQHLQLFSPAEEEQLLRDAGFVDVALFYAAFSFRGWVGVAGPA